MKEGRGEENGEENNFFSFNTHTDGMQNDTNSMNG